MSISHEMESPRSILSAISALSGSLVALSAAMISGVLNVSRKSGLLSVTLGWSALIELARSASVFSRTDLPATALYMAATISGARLSLKMER